ncbi:sensor histidine kinase [Flavobacterium caeni]|uniref:7TM diverse intracellular signalling n=1 Tax=Flavobacterium caeni TaxID=490189 RepID=A0A1G5FDU5_9FLAO|nr:histidine kinase [Flavobacterium caeni]SCY37337.1 7TM diverse intracellular signalling [Flavobacterium caeni]
MNQAVVAGIVWNFVFSGLLIYFLVSMLIFAQSRRRTFLYYGLYNFFLFLYMLRLNPYISSELARDLREHWFGSFFWYVQVVYNSFMFFFYLEFLSFKNHFPKAYRAIVTYLRAMLVLSTVLWVGAMVAGEVNLFVRFFNFVFIPTITFFAVYALYYVARIPGKFRYFVIAGLASYQLLAYVALYKSMYPTHHTDYPILYFYVGIIIESIIFMLGLGYQIRELYVEKINSQERLMAEQAEKHELERHYQQELEASLKTHIAALKKELKGNEEQRVRALSVAFESELSGLKLDALRSQMNPHFIFNAINSIKAYLIENDKEKAVFYLSKFALLIRKILETSRTNSIALAEELEIIKVYLSIESIRYRHEIKTDLPELDAVSAQIQLPGLILQPFIENALWHGLMLKEGEKTLSVSVYQEDGVYKLSVTDNGIGRERAAEKAAQKPYQSESFGVKLAAERLNHFNAKNGTAYSFAFEDLYDDAAAAAGTRVVFCFDRSLTSTQSP